MARIVIECTVHMKIIKNMAENTNNNKVMGLKPPNELENLNAEGFTKWKQRFEIYRIA